MLRTFADSRASASAPAGWCPARRVGRAPWAEPEPRAVGAAAAAAADSRELTAASPTSQRTTPRIGGTGQEHQPELADLHLVPAGEVRGVDALPVQVRAVEAADVAHREALGVGRAQELG